MLSYRMEDLNQPSHSEWYSQDSNAFFQIELKSIGRQSHEHCWLHIRLPRVLLQGTILYVHVMDLTETRVFVF